MCSKEHSSQNKSSFSITKSSHPARPLRYSAFVNGMHFLTIGTSNVFAEWSEEAVFAPLLQYMGCPTAHAGNGKNWGKQVSRDVQTVINGGTVKIDVGV
jgi:hypothetical protein